MRRYTIADVFTDVPLQGNQVAVFTDASGLSTETMQRAAREMNLSETVFVFRAEDRGAHLRVRIFTPATELPFAGHPVLGTAFVVGRSMGSNVVRLETGLGVVPVTLERANGGAPTYGEMEQLVPVAEPFEAVDELLAALGVGAYDGLPIEAYRNGPAHVYVELPSEHAVAALRPDIGALERLGVYGINCFAGDGLRWKLRMFGPAGRRRGPRRSTAGRSRFTVSPRVALRSGPSSGSCRASRSGAARCCARASRGAGGPSSACSWAARR